MQVSAGPTVGRTVLLVPECQKLGTGASSPRGGCFYSTDDRVQFRSGSKFKFISQSSRSGRGRAPKPKHRSYNPFTTERAAWHVIVIEADVCCKDAGYDTIRYDAIGSFNTRAQKLTATTSSKTGENTESEL